MRRLLLRVAAIVALASPASAQQSVVTKYRAQFPTPMTREQTLVLLRSVAAEVRVGLLVKRDGNNCGGYACDIVCKSSTELYDVLGDAEGAATPQWTPTTNPRGYACELVAQSPPPSVPPPATPPPDTPPPAGAELATAELQRAQVAALIEIVHQLQIQNAALAAAVVELKNQIAAGVRIRF